MNEKNEQQEKTEQEVHVNSTHNISIEPLMELLPEKIKANLLDSAIKELFEMAANVGCSHIEAESTLKKNNVENKYVLSLKRVTC